MTIELNLTTTPYVPQAPLAVSDPIPSITGLEPNYHVERMAKDAAGQYYVVAVPSMAGPAKGFVYIGKPQALARSSITRRALYRDGGSVDIFFEGGMLHFPAPHHDVATPIATIGKNSVPLEDLLRPKTLLQGVREFTDG